MIPDVEAREAWIRLVEHQERELDMQSFDQDAAIAFVQNCLALAEQNYHKSIAASVVLEGTLVALVMMEGTNLYNQLSLTAKRNVSIRTAESSMMTFLKVKYGMLAREPWMADSENTMLCGGCIPIRIRGRICGYAAVSNMTHEEDHQMCAEALARLSGRDIATILK